MMHLALSDVAMQHCAATQHKSSVELAGHGGDSCGIRMTLPDHLQSAALAAPL
jgi:hypothetical protein